MGAFEAQEQTLGRRQAEEMYQTRPGVERAGSGRTMLGVQERYCGRILVRRRLLAEIGSLVAVGWAIWNRVMW